MKPKKKTPFLGLEKTCIFPSQSWEAKGDKEKPVPDELKNSAPQIGRGGGICQREPSRTFSSVGLKSSKLKQAFVLEGEALAQSREAENLLPRLWWESLLKVSANFRAPSEALTLRGPETLVPRDIFGDDGLGSLKGETLHLEILLPRASKIPPILQWHQFFGGFPPYGQPGPLVLPVSQRETCGLTA